MDYISTHHLCKILPLVILLTGCAALKTQTKHYENVESKVERGQYTEAAAHIKSQNYEKKNRVLYYLDLGIVEHYGGDYANSNLHLEKADRMMEELFTKSISRATASLLLNDNTMEYFGEDYENIYVNIFKSLNYYHKGNFDDAMVEVRRVDEKLKLFAQKYRKLAENYNKSEDKRIDFKLGKNRFHNDALARYLSMLLYRADGKYDDSRIDQDKIKEAWQTQSQIYDFPIPEAVSEALKPTNKTRLNVLSFIGWGPKKHQKVLYIHTEKNLVGIYSSSTCDKNSFLDIFSFPVDEGYHFKFALPSIKERPSKIASIGITVNGKEVGRLQLLEDMSKVAVESYKLKEPIIYFKSITRAVVKGTSSHAAKEKITKDDSHLISLFKRAVVDACVDATENADLRSWRMMPGKCYVGEFKIDEGVWDITVNYYSADGMILRSHKFPAQEIKKNSLNLLETVINL
jgi:hypothetical protein